jgi:beta-galactosidase GanA
MRILLAIAALLFAMPVLAQESIPHLDQRGEAVQLIVDGEPFLILGGELGNSTASDREYMARHWDHLQQMNLNTVLAPVYWELIEPEEDHFDFTSVDWLIEDARAHDMRLVLLWFATWKNSMSSYVPSWVKRDAERFPRTIGAGGQTQEIISAYSPEARDADARAFAALMAHLRAIDGAEHTVIMVQVENEIGFLPFAGEEGNGEDPAATEREMARAYARFANTVADAGKREYPLPLFVNGAQRRPSIAPGDYPSGGPLAHLADIWREEAPAVDFIAPDIYFPNFAGIVDGYVEAGASPLFIPEANRPSDPALVANALRSIGLRNAIGFSPFAIEGADDVQAERIAGLYAMLESMSEPILEAQAEGRIAGFGNEVSFAGEVDTLPMQAEFGAFRFSVTTIDPWTPVDAQDPRSHGALLIWLGGEDFLFAGMGATLTAESVGGLGSVGFDIVEEGTFEAGEWIAVRRLNGDQTHQGRHVRLPPGQSEIQRFRLYRY